MKKIAFLLLLFITIKAEAKTGESFLKKTFFIQDDTLNLLISAAGNVFYYDSPLAEDGSNFKWIAAKDIKDVILLFEQEAKQKGHSLVVVIKTAPSKKAGDIARRYPNYTRGKWTETEKELIKLTEGAKNGKNN